MVAVNRTELEITAELAVDVAESFVDGLELGVQHVHLLTTVVALHLLQLGLQLLLLLQQIVVQ